MSPRLAIEELEVAGPEGLLVGPVSLEVAAGGVRTVLGETGAGKSLLAQAILGNLPAGLGSRGAVILDGRRIDGLSPRDRSRLWGRTMALLPQEPWRALDPTMQALAQVAETHRFVAGRSWAKASRSARGDFAALGLAGAVRQLPGTLSGGMAQRAAFAAACAGGAEVVLADEPTKGLDAMLRDGVTALLARVARMAARSSSSPTTWPSPAPSAVRSSSCARVRSSRQGRWPMSWRGRARTMGGP